jgi:hypothetical protein
VDLFIARIGINSSEPVITLSACSSDIKIILTLLSSGELHSTCLLHDYHPRYFIAMDVTAGCMNAILLSMENAGSLCDIYICTTLAFLTL